jgi:alkanesulfonate monooxygenase SsuD/methylene tetrahydromethanopterin reductase-like flavin-dependent oxidoreductase (luciferase family)
MTAIEIGAAIEQTGLSLAETYERAAIAEQAGCTSLWMVQLPNQRDAFTILGGLAARTKAVRLASSVVPLYTRPPIVMAQTALTLDEMSGNRLMLGLGLGNPMVGQWMLGSDLGPPVQSAREYLTVLTSLIRTGEVSFTGKWYSGNGTYPGPRRPDLPVYLGTFGPRMVELAGELADGLILWLCTPQYVRETIMPSLRAGWARRETPRGEFPITIMLTLSATDPAAARDGFRRGVSAYSRVPAYRRMLEASGFGADLRAGRIGDDMADALGAFGTEDEVRQRLAAYIDAGVTRFAIAPQTGTTFDPDRFVHNLSVARSVPGGPGDEQP